MDTEIGVPWIIGIGILPPLRRVPVLEYSRVPPSAYLGKLEMLKPIFSNFVTHLVRFFICVAAVNILSAVAVNTFFMAQYLNTFLWSLF